MTTKKPLLAAACAALFSIGTSFAGGEGWLDDFEAAKKQAAEEGKSLLIDFTGSDWCGWCIKLDKEVFQEEAFKAGVKDKFVLVELDYPKDKSKLSAETIQQNEELKNTYSIQGYPTILVTDATGKPFAATGYQAGGPEKYVVHLDEKLTAKTKLAAALEDARKAEGADKATALIAALNDLGLQDELIDTFYSDVVQEIKDADPTGETRFVAKLGAKQKYAKFEAELQNLVKTGDFQACLDLTNKAIEDKSFEGEQLQKATLMKAMVHARMTQIDKAIIALDEAKAVDPTSPLAAQIDIIKAQVEKTAKEQPAPPAGEKAAE